MWLVDPLDGTVNFANRKPPFGTMVALLHGGETKVAWIHNPLSKQTAVAEKGGGASINGTPCKTLAPAKQLVGVVLTGFVPTEYRSAVENAFDGFTTVPPTRCAVQHYLEMAEGHIHFSFYWRTRPWDHAPGVLLIEECGGKAARLDGTPYRPADKSKGLLVAADTTAWQAVQGKLPEDLRRPNPD